jgi:hypothetical protein
MASGDGDTMITMKNTGLTVNTGIYIYIDTCIYIYPWKMLKNAGVPFGKRLPFAMENHKI